MARVLHREVFTKLGVPEFSELAKVLIGEFHGSHRRPVADGVEDGTSCRDGRLGRIGPYSLRDLMVPIRVPSARRAGDPLGIRADGRDPRSYIYMAV
jgi:hypothetical protein